MKSSQLLFLFFMLTMLANAQSLSGVITDSQGNTIPYATIFVKELSMGTTSNSEGKYNFNLPKGEYEIQFRSLGFKPQVLHFNIDSLDDKKDVMLSEYSIQLQEIRVYKGTEDPAYPIMRRAISMASYYLNQVEKYKAEVYIKGTAEIAKAPKLLAKNMKVIVNGNNLGFGDLFVGENISEIEFEAPNTFRQKIISSKTTSTDKNEKPFKIGLMTSSVYASEMDEMIMPLSPKSFSYYNFRYEGYFVEGEYLINKIKLIPKRKSSQLFSGYLYVVDGLWCIHSIELITNQVFGEIDTKIHFFEVEDKVWLPVGHHISIDAKIMGISGGASYVSAVKYLSYKKNENMAVPFLIKEYDEGELIKDEIAANEQSKYLKKIEELMQKEDLTNRDVLKMARLMKKNEKEKPVKDTIAESFEIKETYHVETNDSTIIQSVEYWQTLRPNPLTSREMESFVKADSLKLAIVNSTDSLASTKSSKQNLFLKIIGSKTKNFRNDSIKLRVSGLVNPLLLSFNPVEGFKYRQVLQLNQKLNNSRELNYRADLGYAFGAKQLQWKLKSEYNYAPLKRAKLWVEVGSSINDFSGENDLSPMVNTITSLFLKQSYARYLHENYFTISNEFELVNGLVLQSGFNFRDRSQLSNVTDFSFLKADGLYAPNEIIDFRNTTINLEDNRTSNLELLVQYTPNSYYRIKDGRKLIVGSSWPTFVLGYKKGFPNFLGSTFRWDFLSAELSQDVKIRVSSKFQYTLKAGSFLTNSLLAFADYAQIRTSYLPVDIKSTDMKFKLLPYYTYHTNQMFSEAHFMYTTPYLLIKYLPWINKQSFTEKLHLSYLTMPDLGNYVEVGYGLSGLMFIGDLGVFTSFNNGKFAQTSVKISFRF